MMSPRLVHLGSYGYYIFEANKRERSGPVPCALQISELYLHKAKLKVIYDTILDGVPEGPVTRSRAKRFKESLNGFIREVWEQEASRKPMEGANEGEPSWKGLDPSIQIGETDTSPGKFYSFLCRVPARIASSGIKASALYQILTRPSIWDLDWSVFIPMLEVSSKNEEVDDVESDVELPIAIVTTNEDSNPEVPFSVDTHVDELLVVSTCEDDGVDNPEEPIIENCNQEKTVVEDSLCEESTVVVQNSLSLQITEDSELTQEAIYGGEFKVDGERNALMLQSRLEIACNTSGDLVTYQLKQFRQTTMVEWTSSDILCQQFSCDVFILQVAEDVPLDVDVPPDLFVHSIVGHLMVMKWRPFDTDWMTLKMYLVQFVVEEFEEQIVFVFDPGGGSDLRTNPFQEKGNDTILDGVPEGPVTRSRAKRFKESLNGFIREVWEQEASRKPMEGANEGEPSWKVLISAQEAYYGEMLEAMRRADVEEYPEDTMERFPFGLRHEIRDVVESRHYEELEDMVQGAIKVEKRLQKESRQILTRPSIWDLDWSAFIPMLEVSSKNEEVDDVESDVELPIAIVTTNEDSNPEVPFSVDTHVDELLVVSTCEDDGVDNPEEPIIENCNQEKTVVEDSLCEESTVVVQNSLSLQITEDSELTQEAIYGGEFKVDGERNALMLQSRLEIACNTSGDLVTYQLKQFRQTTMVEWTSSDILCQQFSCDVFILQVAEDVPLDVDVPPDLFVHSIVGHLMVMKWRPFDTDWMTLKMYLVQFVVEEFEEQIVFVFDPGGGSDLRTNPFQEKGNDTILDGVPEGPVTRSRTKRFKESLNGFIREVWEQEASRKPMEGANEGEPSWKVLISAQENFYPNFIIFVRFNFDLSNGFIIPACGVYIKSKFVFPIDPSFIYLYTVFDVDTCQSHADVNPELLKKLVTVVQDGEDFNSPICISPPTDIIITCCAHIFCELWILKMLKRTKACCPMCHHPLSESNLYKALPESSQTTSPQVPSSSSSYKVAALLKLLTASRDANPSSKSIIFSQFRKMLLLLEEPLKEPFRSIDECKEAITVEEQAMDSVHRIGQMNHVKIVRMVTRNTIDERILQLQEKRMLAKKAFGLQDQKDQREINRDDLDGLDELVSCYIAYHSDDILYTG
ncbi:hypothetical protein C2S53_002287 [Perilla frutescens var. hirtella]|uniref:RING-type domain-containing protein n=1 Tax=Perilla frutescens var. hirtella TaxID=608512 RepID=A0AAD4J0I1_PERFH|nr:hypothetical protein C2S53_002287 [Perilla frutescens var. hirtella]